MSFFIILTTMVRNEHVALPRLLRSCAGIVDAVALTDTGSTDNTLEVAQQVCKEIGLRLFTFQDTWSDFGTNRTKNLEHGRVAAAELGAPQDCHLLLLDADMEIPKGTTRPTDLPDIGMMDQGDGKATWSNVRTIRASIPAVYVGRTHEYLSHQGPGISKLNWFKITDHCDGGCRSDKFERDERLLRLDLAEKNDGRSMFYLGQTLQNLGRKREAIEFYDRRAKLSDFPEEAWVARMEAARCAEGPEADQRAWEAFYSRPKRAEPLADIAKRAADQGRHNTAMAAAAIGKQIPIPTDELLYLNSQFYGFPFAYAEMLSGYYTGQRELGAQACEYLHFSYGSPWSYVALGNSQFYADPLPGKRTPLLFTPPEGFVPMNPSLRKTRTGWMALIRTVNYRIAPNGAYLDPQGNWFTDKTPIITRNFIVYYSEAMEPQGDPIELIAPKSPRAGAIVTGFEDLRFVAYNADTKALVTAGVRLDANSTGVPEFWEVTWDLNTGVCVADRKISHGDKCEKNWLPFGDGLYLYGHDPAVIFVDKDGKPVEQSIQTVDVKGFRGSAAPIPYRDGFLYVVHEVWIPQGGRRVYLHRFVYATRSPENPWRIEAISRPFLMQGQPCIECCFSVNNVPGGVLLTCSKEDSEVYTIEVAATDVDALLAKGTAPPKA